MHWNDTIPDNIHSKYPVILAHGIMCHDRNEKEVDSWGRIPKALRERGLQVYYGQSDSWGTIEQNAQELKETVLRVIEETGCEKVNIIAHSKGGLDARYMITHLDMEDKVASLTTINTPHRGVIIVDLMQKIIPTKLYKFVSNKIDQSALKKGDVYADCYLCSKELSKAYCTQFNKDTPNSDKVFYQSFSSSSKSLLENGRYFLPSILIKMMSKDNSDGIVPRKSSQWDNFTEFEQFEGYSHSDIVDCGPKAKKSNLILMLYLNLIMILVMRGL